MLVLESSVFCRQHRKENIVGVLLITCNDVVASAVTHFASASTSPVGDSIHQLVIEDVPDVQLAAIFKQGCEWVSHIQSGLPLVLTYFQLEFWFAYISCEGETGGSHGVRLCNLEIKISLLSK